MKLTSEQLAGKLSTIVDQAFACEVIQSYIEMQRRFLAGDWKPTELDGGRLCEAVARSMRQLDLGSISHAVMPGEVIRGLIDSENSRIHKLSQKERAHFGKVLGMVYELRSDRGAVHISPEFSANYMDAMLVLHSCKWMFAEFLRLAWNKDRKTIAETIEQIVQLQHSIIHELDGKPLVLVTNISAPEEVLLLLFHAPNNRLTRAELREQAADQKPNNVNTAISRLIIQKQIRPVGDNEVALTPSGQKRVIEEIMPKYSSY